MASGKTTVGHKLSKELGMSFYDTDQVIEARNGVSISTIFDIEGEEGFRHRETEVIEELTNMKGVVLSTGGGVIIAEQNRRYLKERGFVIYLKASIDLILKRTAKDKKRPLLQSADPKQKLIELAQERDPLYEEIADLTIDTENCVSKEIVQKIYNHEIHR